MALRREHSESTASRCSNLMNPFLTTARSMPTFMLFEQGKVIDKVQGADPRKLQDVVKKLVAAAEGSSSSSSGLGSSSGSGWRIGNLPKGYNDITDQVDVKGLELLNADSEFGSVRTLFEAGKPTGLQKGKGAENKTKDWVESDTDEQLMLFMPFQATLKVHTLQVCLCSRLWVAASANMIPCRSRPYHLRTRMTRCRCDPRQSKFSQTALISSVSKKQTTSRQRNPSPSRRRTGIRLAQQTSPSASSSSRMSQA